MAIFMPWPLKSHEKKAPHSYHAAWAPDLPLTLWTKYLWKLQKESRLSDSVVHGTTTVTTESHLLRSHYAYWILSVLSQKQKQMREYKRWLRRRVTRPAGLFRYYIGRAEESNTIHRSRKLPLITNKASALKNGQQIGVCINIHCPVNTCVYRPHFSNLPIIHSDDGKRVRF
jgi:hypothetical protein